MLNLPDRTFGNNLQPLHQNTVLRFGNIQYIVGGTRPVQSTLFNSFIDEQRSVSCLSKYSDKKAFDPVCYSSTEQEQNVPVIGSQLNTKADNGTPPIYAHLKSVKPVTR